MIYMFKAIHYCKVMYLRFFEICAFKNVVYHARFFTAAGLV